MAANQPNPIDIHVGARLRMRRMQIGMTQEKLGDHLKLTFQQIQKYEKGTNRISASKLYMISRLLGVTVQYFFDDMPESDAQALVPNLENADGNENISSFMSSKQGIDLSKSFLNIKSEGVQKSTIELIKAMSRSDNEKLNS